MAFSEEGVLLFRPGGQTKFQNKFRLFYINKLQQESDSNYKRAANPDKKQPLAPIINSKPQINKKSDILAKKRRAEDETLGVNIV